MDQYEKFILKKKEEFERSRMLLENQERRDEAAFYKIRMNICAAFLDVWHAVQKLQDPKEAYRCRLVQIPENWQKRLKEAEKHDDAETATIEQVKLETADVLSSEFERLIKEGLL